MIANIPKYGFRETKIPEALISFIKLDIGNSIFSEVPCLHLIYLAEFTDNHFNLYYLAIFCLYFSTLCFIGSHCYNIGCSIRPYYIVIVEFQCLY